MAQQAADEIAEAIIPQLTIGPGRPVGGGNGGGGGGCMPGTTLLSLPLGINPDSSFVGVGTVVHVTGSAKVRRFLPDCTKVDVKAPIEWRLTYQSPDSPVSIPVTSFFVDGVSSPANEFTAGNPGIYDIVLICPLVGAATSTRVNAGRGALLVGTATAWVSNPILGCRKYDTGPDGNPIPFQALIVTSPHGSQSVVDFDPIRLPKVVVTQTSSGTGDFDPSTGTIDAQLHASVQAVFNGTVNMTLSTSGTITPCGGSSEVSGKAISGGQAVLVGHGQVGGVPFGGAQVWLAVTANVTPIGF